MRGDLTTAWVVDAPRVPTTQPGPLPHCRGSTAEAYWLERTTGAVLIAFGLRVAVERR